MSHRSLIDEAMERARLVVASGAQPGEKSASAPTSSLAEEARTTADAMEYVSLKLADDGTAEGAHHRAMITDFLSSKTAMRPAESVAPTGVQATPPASGGKTLTPSSGATARGPATSEAPTGTQATLDQPYTPSTVPTEPASSKKASLYDMILGDKTAAKGGPRDTIALDGFGAPPAKNENTNLHLIRSNEGPVNATKRSAKLPTRARLKQLFAHAGDTSASQAAARATWPTASRKGGLKIAAKEKDDTSRRAFNTGVGAAKGSLAGGVGGATGGAAVGGAGGAALGGIAGALHGKGGVGNRLANGVMGAAEGGFAGGAGGAILGATPGALSGAVSGAVSGHKKKTEKKGSVREWAELYDMAANGQIGREAQAFTHHIEQIGMAQ